jgi:hypothetical protein
MTSSKLETLSALLRTASSVVDELVVLSDSVLARVARIFARMPAEDRESIVDVLEREVNLRLIARSTDRSLSGFTMGPPNPNARIYARLVCKNEPFVTRDQLMLGVLRALRTILAAPAETRAQWEETTLEAFRQLDPAERDAIARVNHDMLALLERADQKKTAKAS